MAKLSGIMSLRHDLSKEDYTYVSNLPSIEKDDDFERYKLFCINHSSQKLRGMPIPSPVRHIHCLFIADDPLIF